MYCTDCGSRNPNDSKYCRECGRKILTLDDEARLAPLRPSKSVNIDSAPEPPDDPERLRHLLDMAFWHNEVGNITGAVLACEAALKVDPNSTSALSLLGCLYEKQGKVEKAIETFERVVQLNPESTADFEKLQHLLRGISDKAVSPSLIHQITPPVVLVAVRKYPSLPAFAAAFVVFLLVGFGLKSIWDKFVPPTDTKTEAVSSVAAINPDVRGMADYNTNPSEPTPPPVQNYAAPQTPTYSQPVQAPPTRDPFVSQRPGNLDQIANAQSQQAANYSSRPEYQNDLYSNSMPSYENVKPLTVPVSMVPNHVVPVAMDSQTNDHTVMVDPAQSNDQSAASTQTDDSSDQPAPPASHIWITVHGDSDGSDANGATPLPADTSIHTISLSENAGASLQQKGLNLQEAGNYRAAVAAYQSAIAAYQQDINNGRNTDAAKRGIDACQVAVEICKQSQ